jgi:hypothetical protein
MTPADEIKRLIQKSEIESSPEVDARIMGDALDQLDKRRQDKTARPEAGVWRIVMRSNITKLAAAAAIVIAVLIGFHFVGNPFASTLTFAKVIQPILNANTAVLDIVIGEEKEGVPVIHDMIMGSRIRRTLFTLPGTVTIIDLKDSRILTLSEEKKEAQYVSMKGLPSIPNYLDNLKNVITKLQDDPQFRAEGLGQRQFDGQTLIGFRATHPRMEVTIWADPSTGLPVRIEQNEGQLRVICKNVRFDEPMPDALFSMDVPPGYKLQQETILDLTTGTEENFIEGLRLLASTFNNGVLPDGIAVEDYIKQAPAIAKQIEAMNLSAEEQTKLGEKIQSCLLFTRFFKGEGKWYYRGKGVKLGDAATPIFWYRPKGSATYRVIYGDLHVADVAPENLPEPPAADDASEAKIGFQQWSKPDFVGSQEDTWHVTASGAVVIQSDVTLMKGPQGVSVMPVTLPYATGVLTSVLLGEIAVPFQPAGQGRYNLQLPMDKLLAGQTKLTCTWTLALGDLEKATQNVPLKTLILAVSYKLTVTLDPDSGWQYVNDPSKSTWVPFSIGNPPQPSSNFGTCGLSLQKRK